MIGNPMNGFVGGWNPGTVGNLMGVVPVSTRPCGVGAVVVTSPGIVRGNVSGVGVGVVTPPVFACDCEKKLGWDIGPENAVGVGGAMTPPMACDGLKTLASPKLDGMPREREPPEAGCKTCSTAFPGSNTVSGWNLFPTPDPPVPIPVPDVPTSGKRP